MAGNLGFETWVLADAMATHERRAPDGEIIAADVMHRTALASLDGEFAEVLDTATAIARLGAPGHLRRPSAARSIGSARRSPRSQ